MNKKSSVLIVLVVLMIVSGIGIRLINLQNPPLDLHGFRQLRSLVLARKYFYNLSPGVAEELRIKANYLGSQFEIMEPPLIESIMAGGYLVFGKEIPYLGRVLNILLWGFSAFFLFDLAKRLSNSWGGGAALLYYLFLPFGVLESRTIMPNPMMVSFIVIALWAVYRWVPRMDWKWTIIAGILSGFAILIKVFAIFHVLIPAGFILLQSDKVRNLLRNKKVWTYFILSGVIPLLYYLWVPGRSASNYLTTWSLNYLNLLIDPYFYLSWFHVLNGQFGLIYILGGIALIPLLKRPDSFLILGLWVSYFVFGATLPSLIITHTYYSLPLVPIVAFTLASFGTLIKPVLQSNKFGKGLLVAALAVGLAYNAVLIRKQLNLTDFRQEPVFWSEISEELPNDGTYIGLSEDYNMRMNYYGWRSLGYFPYSYDLDMGALGGGGYDPDHIDWSFFLHHIDGFDYFLVTELSQFEKQPYLREALYSYYPVVTQGERYVLFDLRNPIQPIPED